MWKRLVHFHAAKAQSSLLTLRKLKDTESAERFYDAKVQQLQSNIQDLEIIVQRKTSNVRSVEDGKYSPTRQEGHALGTHTSQIVLRQKVVQSQAA